MSKKIAVSGIIVFAVIFFLSFPNPVFSRHKKIVLGDSTVSAAQQFPPTTEGPGLILPDSPFFFLDEIKQNIRLAFALTPEAKAKLHNAIAGERLAELRLMMNKSNANATEKALRGVRENFAKVASQIEEARLSGRDISDVARQINNNIKAKQESLDEVVDSADTELSPEIEEINKMLLETKVQVEEGLPEDELENEIEEDLNRVAEYKVRHLDISVEEIDEVLEELYKQANEAAKKSLKRREEALKRAIEEKNEAFRKTAEKLLEAEKRKRQKLLEAYRKVAQETKDALERTYEITEEFKKTQEAIIQIKNSDFLETDSLIIPMPTVVPIISTVPTSIPKPTPTVCDKSLSGTVYQDINGDGQFDQSPPQIKPFVDKGLGGWTVLLKNEKGTLIKSTISNSSGSYNLNNLCAGIYSVSEEIKDGWTIVEPINNLYSISISQYGNAYIDFGNVLFPTPTPVSPKIYSLSPSSGPSGQAIIIKGSLFGWDIGGVTFCLPQNCSYGAQIGFWSDTEIKARVPGILTQAVAHEVYVTTRSGKASNKVIFTITAGQPTIDSISPSGAKPGEQVIITGSNFGTGNGQVKFYKTYPNVESTGNITFWSNTQIKIIIPSNLSPGSEYAIQVVNPGGAGSSVKYYNLGYSYTAP